MFKVSFEINNGGLNLCWKGLKQKQSFIEKISKGKKSQILKKHVKFNSCLIWIKIQLKYQVKVNPINFNHISWDPKNFNHDSFFSPIEKGFSLLTEKGRNYKALSKLRR